MSRLFLALFFIVSLPVLAMDNDDNVSYVICKSAAKLEEIQDAYETLYQEKGGQVFSRHFSNPCDAHRELTALETLKDDKKIGARELLLRVFQKQVNENTEHPTANYSDDSTSENEDSDNSSEQEENC
jgi:hypothetical protein